MDDPSGSGSLSEEKAALVLDRAAKLDSTQGSRVTIEALREIALEAGISPEAFERALAEVRAGTAPAGHALRPTAPPKSTGIGGSVGAALLRGGIFAIGALLAFLAVALPYLTGIDEGYTVMMSLIIAMFVAIALVASRHQGRKVLDFEIDLGMLWAGLTLVFMVANPDFAGVIMEVMAPVGVGAGLVGGLIVALGPTESKPEELPERT